jgi:hypothetical protein
MDSIAVLESIPYTLALMRHHGAPTRLLDFTYSPFIALFFALRHGRSTNCARDAAGDPELPTIWCVDLKKLDLGKNDSSSPLPSKADQRFINTFMKGGESAVRSVNSYLLSERLQLQQGVFLASCNLGESFQDNLLNMAGASSIMTVVKFAFNKPELRRALIELWRMNLSEATLFPGLDGFCRSFSQRICLFNSREFARVPKAVEGLRSREWQRRLIMRDGAIPRRPQKNAKRR